MASPPIKGVSSTTQSHSETAFLKSSEFRIMVAILWNFICVIGSVLASIDIFNQDGFYDLGDPVQYFAAFVALVPALVGLYGSFYLFQKKGQGRYATMGLNYVVMVLAFCYLLHLWGVFIGFDDIAAAIHQNTDWLIGFAIGYFLFWLGGKFAEESKSRLRLEQAGLAVAMLALVGLLWFGGILDALGHILGEYGELRTWLVTLVILISGGMAYQILLLGKVFGELPEGRVAWQGWLMLSPNIIGFMLFFAGPLLLSFYLSFTQEPRIPLSKGQLKNFDTFVEDGESANISQDTDTTPQFVFLENYGKLFDFEIKTQDDLDARSQEAISEGKSVLFELEIFDQTRLVIGVGAKEKFFWIGLWNTIRYCFLLLPMSIIPALGLSVMLNSKLPGVRFYRALYFLPSVAAVVGIAIIWREAMYGSIVGYVNWSITQIIEGINGIFGTEIEDPKIVWIEEAPLFSLVLMSAWQTFGFNTVIFLAGLQGIPSELYEAAEVDGANKWSQFRHITLPLLAPTTFFVTVTTIINGLQVFNEPWVLFRGQAPEGATTAVMQLYRTMFFESNFGMASAIAWIVFILIFAVTILQFRLSRSNAYDK